MEGGGEVLLLNGTLDLLSNGLLLPNKGFILLTGGLRLQNEDASREMWTHLAERRRPLAEVRARLAALAGSTLGQRGAF